MLQFTPQHTLVLNLKRDTLSGIDDHTERKSLELRVLFCNLHELIVFFERNVMC